MRVFILFSLIVASVIPTQVARAQTWQRAEIAFLEWDVSTLVSMSPERLRDASAATKFTIKEGLPEFVASLGLAELRRGPLAGGGDARLVIDLFSEKGERTTYYASRFRLYSLESDARYDEAKGVLQRPIDAAFRERFQAMAKAHAGKHD